MGRAVLSEIQGRARHRFLTAGIGARLGFYGGLSYSLGVLGEADFGYPIGPLRIELTGVAGINAFRDLENADLVQGDPGYDVALPFAGARLSAAWILKRSRLSPFVGLSVFFERDLKHGSKTYDYAEELLSDEMSVAHHAYGWTRIGGFISAGALYSLSPR